MPPPVQFEVPAHVWSYWDVEDTEPTYEETRPAARVGAFVAFDADGRVTELGAPTNQFKVGAGAPIYYFNGPSRQNWANCTGWSVWIWNSANL